MCDNNMKGVNVETMVTEMYDEWLNGVKFVFELEEKEKEKEKEKAEKRKGQKREVNQPNVALLPSNDSNPRILKIKQKYLRLFETLSSQMEFRQLPELSRGILPTMDRLELAPTFSIYESILYTCPLSSSFVPSRSTAIVGQDNKSINNDSNSDDDNIPSSTYATLFRDIFQTRLIKYADPQHIEHLIMEQQLEEAANVLHLLTTATSQGGTTADHSNPDKLITHSHTSLAVASAPSIQTHPNASQYDLLKVQMLQGLCEHYH
ncbi:hypothetical protein RFI_30820, partial [Reticulomyxa filosa]